MAIKIAFGENGRARFIKRVVQIAAAGITHFSQKSAIVAVALAIRTRLINASGHKNI